MSGDAAEELVLAVLLFTNQESITAGEIAEQLGDVGLIERVPAPGSRREHYRCPDDAWARLTSSQSVVVRMMLRAVERGIGADSVTGRRLAVMHDFYTYLMRELPAVLDRWQQSREALP